MFATGLIKQFSKQFIIHFDALELQANKGFLSGWLNNLPIEIAAHSQPSTSFNEPPIGLSKFLNLLCTCPQKCNQSILMLGRFARR